MLVSHASDISRACSRPSPENPFFCPLPAAIAAAAGHSIVRTNGLPGGPRRRPWKRFKRAGIQFIVPFEREEELLGSHYHTTIDRI